MDSTLVIAVCSKGHQWAAQQVIAEKPIQFGAGRGMKHRTRIVTPENCPTCRARWHAVH